MEQDAILNKACDLITQVNVDKAKAAVLLADLPELGKISTRQIAAFVGLPSVNHDSDDHSKEQRYAKGGRMSVRCTLYMATLVAVRHNQILKSFYQRLRNNGKQPKVAFTACMRKLLVIINTIVEQYYESST